MNDSRIARNVTFNLLRAVFLLPLELILIPFVLHRIGVAAFGIWALLRVFIAYGNVFDLGFSAALEKYTAEHAGRGDYGVLNRLFNSSFLSYLAVSLLILTAVFLYGEWISDRFFREGSKAGGDLSFILLFSAATFGANLLLSLYTSLLNGIQRIDLTNTISMGSALFNFMAVLFVLAFDFGLKGLVAANAVVVLATGAATFKVARRHFAEIRLNPFGPYLDFRQFLAILSYSLSVQATRLAVLVHLHLDKFFLGYFLGLQYVAYYEIASRLVERLRVLPQMLIQPIMVAVSESEAKGDQARIDLIYFESLRAMALLSLPFFVFISFFITPIMKLWIGKVYPLTTTAFHVLIIAHSINMLTGPGFLILLGIGRPKYGALCSLAGTLLNVLLGYLLIRSLGYTGALLATFLAVVLPSISLILIFHRIRRIPLTKFLALSLKPAIIALTSAALVSAAVRQWGPEGLAGLSMSFLFFGVLYCAGVWMASGDEERARIRHFIPWIGSRISH